MSEAERDARLLSARALAARARILAVKHAHLLEDSVDRLHVAAIFGTSWMKTRTG